MFDRIYKYGGPSSVSVRVDEHRAPTDDSVKLLAEMEAKAEARVIDRARIGNNLVEGSAVLMRGPHLENTMWLLFRINGQDFKRSVSVPIHWEFLDKSAALEKLTEAMSAEVLAALRHEVSR